MFKSSIKASKTSKPTYCKYSNYSVISYWFMGGFIQDNYFIGEEAAWGDLIF